MNQTWLNVPKPPTSRNTTLQKKNRFILDEIVEQTASKFARFFGIIWKLFIHLEPKLLEKKNYIFVFSDSKNKANFEDFQ